MTKYVCVGDLHGKHEVVQTILDYCEKNDHIPLFIGDYLDSYDREPKDCLKTLDLVIEAVHDEKAIALLGNHEMSYISPLKMGCSGYDISTQVRLDDSCSVKDISRIEYIRNYFLDFYFANGFLVSHAGVSQYLLKCLEKDLNEYLEGGDYDQIGYARGGTCVSGGLYWCDWYNEFEPLKDGPRQIVGHTRTQSGEIENQFGNYCIDCLDRSTQVLLVHENQTVEILNF